MCKNDITQHEYNHSTEVELEDELSVNANRANALKSAGGFSNAFLPVGAGNAAYAQNQNQNQIYLLRISDEHLCNTTDQTQNYVSRRARISTVI